MQTTLLAAAFLCSFTSTAVGQFVGPGLTWHGSAGNGTGSFVAGCQKLPVTAVSPESVTLTVWGDIMSPFGLAVAAGANQCIPVPGIGGGVVLNPPIVLLSFGLLTQMSPCLSCPPGYEQLQFAIPPGLPLGTSVSLQAIALGNGNLSFTVAITATI